LDAIEPLAFEVLQKTGQQPGQAIPDRVSSKELNEDSMSTQPSSATPVISPHPVREAPVSPQVAAGYLNMHRKTVLRKARHGTLPAHPVGRDRKRWHFYLSELDGWLRSQFI
jgi:excisionase family DNA binding protein